MLTQRRGDAEELLENKLATVINGCAIEVHRTLGGPGLLESIYEEALAYELQIAGLFIERQKLLPVTYKNVVLASPLRIDLLIEKTVIVECKAMETYNALCEAQLLTYLRLSKLRLGIVLNFGERMMKDGIHRVANNL